MLPLPFLCMYCIEWVRHCIAVTAIVLMYNSNTYIWFSSFHFSFFVTIPWCIVDPYFLKKEKETEKKTIIKTYKQTKTVFLPATFSFYLFFLLPLCLYLSMCSIEVIFIQFFIIAHFIDITNYCSWYIVICAHFIQIRHIPKKNQQQHFILVHQICEWNCHSFIFDEQSSSTSNNNSYQIDVYSKSLVVRLNIII